MIPKVSVNELVDMLLTIYSNTNNHIIDLPSYMLWGPPGVGKSDAVKQFALELEKSTGKKVIITDVRLLLYNPVDLKGMPTASEDKKFCIWLKPFILNMDESDDVINILMLDELTAASPSVQATAYQITLDRQVGEHKLADNCIVMAAGNRTTDKSVAYTMPKALGNRLVHFEIDTSIDAWKFWAMENNIDSKIIGFLNFKSDMLFNSGTSDMVAFPTPRSWVMASKFMKMAGSDASKAYNFIAGCVGSNAASEFKVYTKVYAELPDINDIAAGKKVTVTSKDPSVMYALITSLVTRAYHSSQEQLNNIIKFLGTIEEEFSIKAIHDMFIVPKIRDIMFKCEEMPKWRSIFSEFIIDPKN